MCSRRLQPLHASGKLQLLISLEHRSPRNKCLQEAAFVALRSFACRRNYTSIDLISSVNPASGLHWPAERRETQLLAQRYGQELAPVVVIPSDEPFEPLEGFIWWQATRPQVSTH